MGKEVDIDRFQVASSMLALGMDHVLMPISIQTNEPDFNKAIASVIWSRHHQQTTCQIFNCQVPNCPLCPSVSGASSLPVAYRPPVQQTKFALPPPSSRRTEVVNWLITPSQSSITRQQRGYPSSVDGSVSSGANSPRHSPVGSNSSPSVSPNYLVDHRQASGSMGPSPKSPELPFACRFCPKRFAQASNRSSHMRTHTGDRPFHCPSCPKSFAQRTSLRTHLRTHTGDRPYRCLDCDQRFGDLSTLTKHRRTHTGEKPYRCHYDGCNRAFAQSGNLKRHYRTHALDQKLERISA